MKVLILATGHPSKHLTQAIEDRGHSYDVFNPEDLYLYISESENGYDRIFNGSTDKETPTRIFAKQYDGMVCRIGSRLSLNVAIARHMCENLGIYTPSRPLGLMIASDKLWTSQVLSSYGVKTPLAVFAVRPNHVEFMVNKIGGLPVVAKQLTGSQGAGVSILETPRAANTTLESFYKAGIPIKLQRFLKAATGQENKPTDIRAIVVGKKVVSAMERTAAGNDFRANLSKGGSGRKIDLTPEEEQLCVKAASAIGLDFAGVDLIREKVLPPGQLLPRTTTYVTEINGNPGTGIISITGHNHFVDVIKLLEEKSKRPPVQEEQTGELKKDKEAEAHQTSIYSQLQAKIDRGEKLDYQEYALYTFYHKQRVA